MHIIFFPFLLTAPYLFMFAGSSLVQDPELVVREVEETVANASCRTGNPIDDCWKCDRNWAQNRQTLAACVVGFGRNATGGKHGRIYVVTSPNDDPTNPRSGTLRYGVIQDEPLWITFDQDMVIRLKEELLINSFKTIDGRGANVSVADGPCITIKLVTNVIIHGINIHGCDGDGISILSSNYVWVDHCSLSNCEDGLIDVTHGSTSITISNNYMSHHDKVMLLGHSDDFTRDKNMYVTVAFNHFGEGLVQRMPRCRHGYFHVVYNDYIRWKMYAIGGSAAPTIISQGNRFLAPSNEDNKEVTKRYDAPESEWKDWNWTSKGDLFLNGAYFLTSGNKFWPIDSNYTSLGNISSQVSALTRDAGVLRCTKGSSCGSEP